MKYSYKLNGIAIKETELLEKKIIPKRILQYIKSETLKLYRYNEWDEGRYMANWQLRNPGESISENILNIMLEK